MRLSTSLIILSLSAPLALLASPQRGTMPPQLPQPGPGPSRGAQQPLTYEGMIIGRVVDASTGRPVPGASVAMSGGTQAPMAPTAPGVPRPMPTQPPRFLTDAEGRFAFRNLTRGSYSINVEKAGYLPGMHGQSRPEGPSRSLPLADRERRGDVIIRMFKFATISGMILDDAGEPVVATRVRVHRRTLVSGRRMLQQGQMTQTDDRGQYRITGLMPGEYIVSVPQTSSSMPSDFTLSGPMPADLSSTLSTPGGGGMSFGSTGGPLTADGRFRLSTTGTSPFITAPGASGRVMAYATQYYPTASVVSQAQPVVIGSGEERAGVDLVLRMRSTSSVAGILTGPDGPAVNFALHLVPSDNGDMSIDPSIATAVTDTFGAFAFLAVPSGQYVIQTTRIPRPAPPPPPPPPPPPGATSSSQTITTMGPGGVPITGTMSMTTGFNAGGETFVATGRPSAPTEPTLWVAMPVSVGETDIGGLALMLREGLTVSGQIEFEGSAERPPAQRMTVVSAMLQPADGKQRNGSQQGRADATGRFTIPQVIPGLYRLNVNGNFPGWNLRSAMVNGVDVLDTPFALDTRNITNVVVTFTDRVSTLTGTVRMPTAVTDPAAGQKNPDVAVIVFPSDPQTLAAGFTPRRMRMTRVSSTGGSVGFGGTGGNFVSGPTGAFGFGMIPPGEYYAIAIPDEYASEWQDPKFLEFLARSATRVLVGEGERRTIDLAIEDVRPPGRTPAPATAAAAAAAARHDVDGSPEAIEPRHGGPFVDEREGAPQQARDARIEPAVGSGSISGVVLHDETRRGPVRHARVSVSGGPGGARTVLTDGEGRFMVSSLPAGRYSVTATKAAYLTAYNGATRPGRGPSVPLQLATGQAVTDVTLRMAKGAVVTGMITDEFGTPLQGLTVRVMQPMMREGERTWSTVGIAGGGPNTSDDRGVYRVYGLPPGSYMISVMPPPGVGAETRQLSEDEMRAAIAALSAPVSAPPLSPGGGIANVPTGVPTRGVIGGVTGGVPPRPGLAPMSTPPPSQPPPPAQPPQPPPTFPPAGRAVGYSPVYYPGTALEHEATLVTVGVGQELTGIDLPMRLTATAKIEGTVVTPAGTPAERVSVQVMSASGGQMNSVGVRIMMQGRFTSGNLAPGKYLVTARVNPPPPPPPPPGTAPGSVAPPLSQGPVLWAQQEVVVNGEDIGDVTLTLSEGTRITGRVVFQGTIEKPDPSRVRILAEPVGPNRAFIGVRSAAMDASGAFELTGVTPGRYRLSASTVVATAAALAAGTAPPPSSWALRSSIVDGRDTMDVPIDIPAGHDVRGAVITFTDKPAELSGALLDPARNGVPDLTVVLFATERALWTMNPRRLRSVRSTGDGSFRFAAMPPGEYFLAVISELDQSSWGDPAFMEQIAAAAIRITVGEGEKRVQDFQIK